jgi:hypothetical protein
MKESEETVKLGKWTVGDIESLITGASKIEDTPMRIALLSERLLGTAYRESTLTGDVDMPEVFVINLEGVDCFTFIDYVEAMRLSQSFKGFKSQLKRVRYQSGLVAYEKRNHFFSDWIEFNEKYVEDATGVVGGRSVRETCKNLNIRDDGTRFLAGIPLRTRELAYIPSESIDDVVITKLRTGDYAGIYTEKAGLDVSHVGIIIKDGEEVRLRHASSLDTYRKVIDQDLKTYLTDKPGLMVLRPRT